MIPWKAGKYYILSTRTQTYHIVWIILTLKILITHFHLFSESAGSLNLSEASVDVDAFRTNNSALAGVTNEVLTKSSLITALNSITSVTIISVTVTHMEECVY